MAINSVFLHLHIKKYNSLLKKLMVMLLSGYSLTALAHSEAPVVTYYESDNVTNQIPYFDNRFRIDAQLDEITMVFYRRSGTPPIILVRPDGSKLKINNLPKDKVEWFDDRTFDMIKIKKPMPGPWQAIGNILPNSQILVVSDVKIIVEPLPDIVLVGETIKVTGRLVNGDKALNDPAFREVVNLDVDFFSSNNAAYDNFGAEPIKLTTFRDDGHELDEYANDGIYTGEFELDFAPGEWLPIYKVIMPMATRELRQKPVILHHSPISITVDTSIDEEVNHFVHFNIEPKFVDPDSIILQGKVTFPDRQEEPFSIVEGKGLKRTKDIRYTEPGIHRMKVSVFGKTINGREFRLVLPEFVFNADRLDDEFISVKKENTKRTAKEIAQERSLALQQELEDKRQEKLQQQQKDEEKMMIIITIGNGLIILGAVIFYFFRKKRKSKIDKI
ncbi:MAG: hypothetical protein ACI9LM_003849 [Alteromonadaceae bacterium]|jgi:uncharacterized protein (TIGR03503 family)